MPKNQLTLTVRPAMLRDFPQLPNGYVFQNEVIGSILGRSCIALKSESSEKYVIKVIDKSRFGTSEQADTFLSMIRKSTSIQSKFIAPYLSAIENGNRIYLIRRFVDGVSLAEQITMNHKTDLNYYFVIWKVLLRTLQHLHQSGISPNYIRPSNIFLTRENEPVLVDMYPPMQDFCQRHKNILSVCFLAPEFFTGATPPSESSDIWSVSLIFLYMLTGQIPWNSQNLFKMIQQIIKGHDGIVIRIPEEIREIITKSLQADPTQRATLSWLMAQSPQVSTIETFPGVNHTKKLCTQKSMLLGSKFAKQQVLGRKSLADLPPTKGILDEDDDPFHC